MERKNTLLVVVVSLCLGVFGLIGFWYISDNKTAQTEDLLMEQIVVAPAVEKNVSYVIDRGDGFKREYKASIFSDTTVFSLLEELSKKYDFELVSSPYKDMGMFVESIDGMKNGLENKYWQYWINGELGDSAADRKSVKQGDVIEWKFEVPLVF